MALARAETKSSQIVAAPVSCAETQAAFLLLETLPRPRLTRFENTFTKALANSCIPEAPPTESSWCQVSGAHHRHSCASASAAASAAAATATVGQAIITGLWALVERANLIKFHAQKVAHLHLAVALV